VWFVQGEDAVPILGDPGCFSSRIHVASGEGMMAILDKERHELAVCKSDLRRFRDGHGLRIMTQLESDIDTAHVEWYRLVGKGTFQAANNTFISNRSQNGAKAQWFYQRSDGALDFLHPMHMRCLLRHVDGDLHQLPLTVQEATVLEVEDWSDRHDKLFTMLNLNPQQVPDSAPLCRVFELELNCVSIDALNSVAKEAKDRAKKREDKERRKLKLQMKEREQESNIEDERRKAREKEEAMIRAFFGFEERRAEQELQNAKEKPVMAVNSFSAVVSSMGHFPALQTASTSSSNHSPSLEPVKGGSPWKTTSPNLDPARGNFARGGSGATFTLGGSAPPPTVSDFSFAQAATQGPGKKVLWQNNPGRRGN
jgi:hypothetical protein